MRGHNQKFFALIKIYNQRLQSQVQYFYNLNNVFAKSLKPISFSGHGFESHNDDEVCF